jgi:DeoR/GlpR family transcriptional regulator of sugar metabolism
MIVADSSKFGLRGVAVTGRLTEGVVVVTDAGLPRDVRRAIEKRGVKVVLA